jgi:hypothetical protein
MSEKTKLLAAQGQKQRLSAGTESCSKTPTDLDKVDFMKNYKQVSDQQQNEDAIRKACQEYKNKKQKKVDKYYNLPGLFQDKLRSVSPAPQFAKPDVGSGKTSHVEAKTQDKNCNNLNSADTVTFSYNVKDTETKISETGASFIRQENIFKTITYDSNDDGLTLERITDNGSVPDKAAHSNLNTKDTANLGPDMEFTFKDMTSYLSNLAQAQKTKINAGQACEKKMAQGHTTKSAQGSQKAKSQSKNSNR